MRRSNRSLLLKAIAAAAVLAVVLVPTVASIRLGSSNRALRGEISSMQAQAKADSVALSSARLAASTAAVPTAGSGGNVSYQTAYPSFTGHFKKFAAPPAKTVYLTFDDGPSSNTVNLLNVLSKYNVHATFFTVYKGDAKYKPIMQQIIRQGSVIGIHSYTHIYKKIYASMDSLLYDMNKEQTLIQQATGVKPDIMRLPGGSINDYDLGIYPAMLAELLRRGFVYYDWNVSSMDTDKHITAQEIASNVISGVPHEKIPIVLMHDTADKPNTVQALPAIIGTLQKQGYTFATLNDAVHPAVFGYKADLGDS